MTYIMKMHTSDGSLNAGKYISVFKGMKRHDLLSQSKKQIWKDWITRDDEVISYKTTLKNEKNPRETLILIVFFEKNDGPIKFWDFGPENNIDEIQSKPEGKYTKIMRNWFFENFQITLPQSGSWGEVDAFYDPHNLTTSIICNYRYQYS